MTVFARSVLASLLLAVPVAAEAVGLISGQDPTTETLFVLAQLLGWALVASVAHTLGVLVGGASRWGYRFTVAGVALQLVFASLYLGTLVVSGEPWEGSFVAFLLGFLALTIGGTLWAVRLRRGPQRVAALGLAAVAGLGLVAVAVGDNVVHEITLVGSYLSWSLVGRGAVAGSAAGRPVSAASR